MTGMKEIHAQAVQWIKEAGQRITQSFETILDIETKSNMNDLVTNMDKDVEHFFIEKIAERFPDHIVLGEEGSGHDLKELDGVVWIIDPIDGTMNFVHQQRNFAISIGIIENGVGKIGLIYDVVHDELYHSIRGEGAFLNDKRIEPMKEAKLEESIVGLNAIWLTDNKKIDKDITAKLVRDVRGTRSYGSAALELIYVATGRMNAYISMRLAPWDFAGGSIIIEELGGVVTDLQGNPIHYLKKSSLIATTPKLHEAIMDRYLS
ncbi:inositol monophosphatase family protein [Pradoshia sp.]